MRLSLDVDHKGKERVKDDVQVYAVTSEATKQKTCKRRGVSKYPYESETSNEQENPWTPNAKLAVEKESSTWESSAHGWHWKPWE